MTTQYLSLLRTQILRRLGGEFWFEFSKYVSGGPGLTVSREIVRVVSRSALQWTRNAAGRMPLGGEVAIHSRTGVVGRPGRVFHIPMIDVQGRQSRALRARVREECIRLDAPASIYLSGRGFHVYFYTVIPTPAWHEFLARILLWTPPAPRGPAIPVDIRWVGHSLEHGYSALRLTRYTTEYLKAPEWFCDVSPQVGLTSKRRHSE